MATPPSTFGESGGIKYNDEYFIMPNTLGYMVTWTTYGTWLQGDERQYVKDGQVLPPNKAIAAANRLALKKNPVHLVVKYIPRPIGIVVQRYKTCAVRALRKIGIQGRVWTNGFDTRYCFYRGSLQRKIDYVNSHLRKNIYPRHFRCRRMTEFIFGENRE